MSNRVVETIYRLRDRTTDVLKRITKGYRGSATEAERASNRIEAANRRQRNSVQGVLAAVGRMRFAYFAVAGAIAGAVRGIGSLAKAASDQENAERRLETAIRNGVGATDEQIEALKDLAAERQKVTRFGDEQTLSAQAQLATFKLNADQIAQLTPRVQDLAESQRRLGRENVDLESSAQLVGKALSGNAGELSRYGVILTAAQRETIRLGDANERVAALSEALDANFKGMAESLSPYEQAAQNAKNASGDFVETLGSVITQNPTVTKALQSLTGMFEGMGRVVSENAGAIKRFVSGTVASFRILKNAADVVFDAILLGANRLQRKILETGRNIAESLAKVSFGAARETLNSFVDQADQRLADLEASSEERFRKMGENAADYIESGRDLKNALTGQADAQEEVNRATNEGAAAASDQATAQDEQAAAIERTRRILEGLGVDFEETADTATRSVEQITNELLQLAQDGEASLDQMAEAAGNATKAFTTTQQIEDYNAKLRELMTTGQLTLDQFLALARVTGEMGDETGDTVTDFERLNAAIVEANGHDLTNIASEVRKLGAAGKLSAQEVEKLRAAIEAKRQAIIDDSQAQKQNTQATDDGTKALNKYAKGTDDAKGRAVRLGGAIHLAAEAQALFNRRLSEWQGGGTASYIQFWKRSLEEAIQVNREMQTAESRLQRLREQGVDVNEVTEASNRELRFELMRLRGEKERIAELEERDQRRALQAQIDLATAAGDGERVRLLKERLRLLDQIAKEEEEQARQREQERKREQQDRASGGSAERDQGGGTSTPAPAKAGGVQRVEVNLTSAGGDPSASRLNPEDLRALEQRLLPAILQQLNDDARRTFR